MKFDLNEGRRIRSTAAGREYLMQLAANRIDFCSSQEAASALGVALGTVQQMVERGALDAWKTGGGHRRIRISAVLALLEARSSQVSSIAPIATSLQLKVVVLCVDRARVGEFTARVSSWGLPLHLECTSSGVAAALQVGRLQPDILLLTSEVPAIGTAAFIREMARHAANTEVLSLSDCGRFACAAQAVAEPESLSEVGCMPMDLRALFHAKLAMLIRRSRNNPAQRTRGRASQSIPSPCLQ